MTLLLFVIGLALLVFGARLLVDGASALAGALRISPMVIGLTVVAFGTSAPELAILIQGTFEGEAGVGVGNVVGSSVFNVFVILGLATLFAPLVVPPDILKQDSPIMIGAAILLLFLAADREVGRLDGALLAGIMIVYTVYLIRRERTRQAEEDTPAADTSEAESGPWPLQLGRIIGGLALLVLGASWVVNGAVELAGALGLSPVVIGLTVVAAGTSLPEVATTVQAMRDDKPDFVIGNVVGSNIFNILAVLGIAALVAPDPIPIPNSTVEFDIPVSIAVLMAALMAFATGYRITRLEGALFFFYYALYTAWLILQETGHEAFEWFRPLAVTLALAGIVMLVVNVIRFLRTT